MIKSWSFGGGRVVIRRIWVGGGGFWMEAVVTGSSLSSHHSKHSNHSSPRVFRWEAEVNTKKKSVGSL
jgi:hypothetical protein